MRQAPSEVGPFVILSCSDCQHENEFIQPFLYHAGFGNQGFLYDDAGTCTLVWSTYDPAYEALVGANHPWSLTREQQILLEASLKPAPGGSSWRFSNPPRCVACAAPIGDPIGSSIHFLKYPGSVDASSEETRISFDDLLTPARRITSP